MLFIDFEYFKNGTGNILFPAWAILLNIGGKWEFLLNKSIIPCFLFFIMLIYSCEILRTYFCGLLFYI